MTVVESPESLNIGTKKPVHWGQKELVLISNLIISLLPEYLRLNLCLIVSLDVVSVFCELITIMMILYTTCYYI